MSTCPYCGDDPDLPVLGRWRTFLPVEPPSQNEIASANRGSHPQRRAYRSFRDGYTLLIRAWATKERIPPPAGRRRLVLTRHYSGKGRVRDRINLAGGMKPLLDAFVLSGLLIDDNEQSVIDHYGQERVPGESGVSVLLEEL